MSCYHQLLFWLMRALFSSFPFPVHVYSRGIQSYLPYLLCSYPCPCPCLPVYLRSSSFNCFHIQPHCSRTVTPLALVRFLDLLYFRPHFVHLPLFLIFFPRVYTFFYIYSFRAIHT